MYWWNYRKLAEDLRENRVDERERFKYFLATFIGWNIAVQLFSYSPSPFSIPRFVVVAVCVIIAIIGIAFCYRANKRGDNVDLLARMICLSLPVGVQWASFLTILALTMSIIESVPAAVLGPVSFAYTILGEKWKRWTDPFGGSTGILFNIFYFWTIYAHIAFGAKVKDAENLAALKQTIWSVEHLIFGMLSGNAIAVVTLLLAGAWVPSLGDHRFAWQLLSLLGIMLWTALFAFVFSRYRRRSVEHA